MHARRSPYAILYRAFVVRPGCFSISQLPHGNAYLIGKEKRSWIEYFFAAASNILLGVTRFFCVRNTLQVAKVLFAGPVSLAV